MKLIRRSILLLMLVQALGGSVIGGQATTATRNVVLVTADGVRWEDVFRGAEETLLNPTDGGVADVDALRNDFWRPTPEERRRALMPFFWSVVAQHGQIYGNRDQDSPAKVANGMNFSYPGYNELLTGVPDPRIDSNGKIFNPNVTVFEWLNHKTAYHGKVRAVGSWDLYSYIFNVKRSQLSVNDGWMPLDGVSLTESQRLLNKLILQAPRMWDNCRDDALTFQVAIEHLVRDTPRVFYIGLGDTDEHAHTGRYDKYLRALHDTDANLKTLWDLLQSHPEYRGSTTLLITTDHGRGGPPQGWRSHGADTPGSEAIWMAAIGPDTPALGERKKTAIVTQGQVAATIAAVLGENYLAEVSRAAPPIGEMIVPTPKKAPAITAQSPLQRIAFGSCATQARPQPIWNAVVAAKPELTLLLGDNIYGDTLDMDVMRAKYAKLAAMPGFQLLRKTCPIFATWDDHDLGANDAGGDYPKKDESQKIFLDFFGDLSDSPRRHRPGVYDAKVYGPQGKRVQVIMLDTRYFRSPLKRKAGPRNPADPYDGNPDPTTTILGDAQWHWLGEQLRAPAELRLLVSSIQVVPEDHGFEKWMNFPHERARLFRVLRDSGAEGVIILSGDRHLAELSMMDAKIGYPIYDITASGFNQASRSWRAFETNRHRVATMNWGDNFGFLTIDWEHPDPRISMQIRDVDGDITIQQKIRLSTIRRKPTAPK
jgi:alkaline phosphatase D